MDLTRERALASLRALLRSAGRPGPDDLPALVVSAGECLGASSAVLHLADYDQARLVPMDGPAPTGRPDVEGTVPVEGTLAGRAYSDLTQQVSVGDAGSTLWTPVLDGRTRVGVLQLRFEAGTELGPEMQEACLDLATLLGQQVTTRSLYGDAVERTRRLRGMTLPAELQWGVLPPLAFSAPRVSVAAFLAPTELVAGDSFDYALNGSVLQVAILDAMGHGLEAAMISLLAVSALRNARREGLDLRASVLATEAAVAARFGPDRFVTGVVGELDVATGWWRWTTCGHHPALLLREGRVVKALDTVVGVPLGLGLLGDDPQVGQERLQPGDRLVLYTDGVVEARDEDGEFFGEERLVEFVGRQAAAGRPADETMRRLNHQILGHQSGALQDDATTVLVEWLPDGSA